MSAEDRDLQVLREMYARWAVGDFGSTEEFANEVVWTPDIFDASDYHGIEAMAAQWRGFLQQFREGFRIEVKEITPAADGSYVVMQEFEGIGKASGVEIVTRTALLITMHDGKITRMRGFRDADDTLEAGGEPE